MEAKHGHEARLSAAILKSAQVAGRKMRKMGFCVVAVFSEDKPATHWMVRCGHRSFGRTAS